jgi:trans-aconitate methyltransferase
VQSAINAGIPPADRGTLVDVGCGTGANVALFSGSDERVGIDTTAEAIVAAGATYPNPTFIHGQAPGDLGDIAGRADLSRSWT